MHFSMWILFGFIFPIVIWGIGKIFPNESAGLPLYKNGQLIGFENIGQKFAEDKYFWGRPSAVEYNAASTGGSNKGPADEEYLKDVEKRILHFRAHNPDVQIKDIPVEMITASGSGIDPDISLQAALVQIPRVASYRRISEAKLKTLVTEHLERPLLGLFGPEKINVLKLNLALDELK
ncbi:MAG TPA: potassium-transporting ATPase subunit KdpC [Ignavibacteriales bacterium]|nr:potassium-transporting ATPase subunit KdpC [Ignavibacteriales bacterium]